DYRVAGLAANQKSLCRALSGLIVSANGSGGQGACQRQAAKPAFSSTCAAVHPLWRRWRKLSACDVWPAACPLRPAPDRNDKTQDWPLPTPGTAEADGPWISTRRAPDDFGDAHPCV